MRERQQLDDSIGGIKSLEQDLSDNIELIELGEMEDDKSVITDAEEALRGLKGKVNQLQLNSLLSGEADANDTYLEINSGAGGTESQTGRPCCFACTAGGRKSGASRSKCWNIMTVKKRASSLRPC